MADVEVPEHALSWMLTIYTAATCIQFWHINKRAPKEAQQSAGLLRFQRLPRPIMSQ